MAATDPLRVLVFVGTEGKYHDHLGTGEVLRDILAAEPDIEPVLSQDYELLASGLGAFDTTLFYTDIGSLSEAQEAALLAHVRSGRGFFGLHTAAASFRENAGYHQMVNGFFDGHSKYMDFTVTVVDGEHPVTAGLGDFAVTDELYYLKHDPAKSRRLLEAFDADKNAAQVMAYCHDYGRGRVFYFALGHDSGATDRAEFREVVRRGVRWSARRL